MLNQFMDVFFHLDSKLFLSFRKLLFSPGILSLRYVEGLRKPFMKPLQIFFLVNILFFLLLSKVDLFRIPAKQWQHSEYALSASLKAKAQLKAEQLNLTTAEIENRYEGLSNSFAKGFVVIFIPILALVFFLLFFRKQFQVGKHIVFATHFFSFVLLILVLWSLILEVLFTEVNRWFFVLPVILFSLSYLAIAIRRFYQANLVWTLLASILAFIALLQGIEVYRELISIVSMNSIS